MIESSQSIIEDLKAVTNLMILPYHIRIGEIKTQILSKKWFRFLVNMSQYFTRFTFHYPSITCHCSQWTKFHLCFSPGRWIGDWDRSINLKRKINWQTCQQFEFQQSKWNLSSQIISDEYNYFKNSWRTNMI